MKKKNKKLALYIGGFLLFSFVFVLGFKALSSQEVLGVAKSKSELRMDNMQNYLTEFEKYKSLKDPRAVKTVNKILTNLPKYIADGKECLKITDDTENKACRQVIKDNHQTTKEFDRLIKYFAILEGAKVICTRAELGVSHKIKAMGVGTSQPEQLFLCVDAEGVKKLRVQDAKGDFFSLTPAEVARLNVNDLPPPGNLETLMKELGVS